MAPAKPTRLDYQRPAVLVNKILGGGTRLNHAPRTVLTLGWRRGRVVGVPAGPLQLLLRRFVKVANGIHCAARAISAAESAGLISTGARGDNLPQAVIGGLADVCVIGPRPDEAWVKARKKIKKYFSRSGKLPSPPPSATGAGSSLSRSTTRFGPPRRWPPLGVSAPAKGRAAGTRRPQTR